MQFVLGQAVCEESLFGLYLRRRLAILQRLFYACASKYHSNKSTAQVLTLNFVISGVWISDFTLSCRN